MGKYSINRKGFTMADTEKPEEVTEELMAFDPTMKKKKKKKKTTEASKDAKAKVEAPSQAKEEDAAADEGGELGDMEFGKKKKKKKKTAAPVEPSESEANSDWQESDREYDYFELLDRMQKMLNQEGKSSSTFKDAKLRLPPPDLVRDGTTKTVWTNFPVFCRKLHRSLDHVLEYTLAELGTNGSIDGSQRLTIRGRFMPKQVESVVRHYVAEFVKCNTCGSTDTELKKENRMNFLHCNTCQSRRTVVSINKGYVAQVRRKKKKKKGGRQKKKKKKKKK